MVGTMRWAAVRQVLLQLCPLSRRADTEGETHLLSSKRVTQLGRARRTAGLYR